MNFEEYYFKAGWDEQHKGFAELIWDAAVNAAIDEAVKVIMKRQDDADHPVIGICLNLVDGIKELKE